MRILVIFKTQRDKKLYIDFLIFNSHDLKNSYLNLELASYNSKNEIPKNSCRIVFISEEKQLEEYDLSDSLSKNVATAFEDKKDEVITLLEILKAFGLLPLLWILNKIGNWEFPSIKSWRRETAIFLIWKV